MREGSAGCVLDDFDARLHLVGKNLQTSCGIQVDSCNYENFVLTGCEEEFLTHPDGVCPECAAEMLKELMQEEYLGG